MKQVSRYRVAALLVSATLLAGCQSLSPVPLLLIDEDEFVSMPPAATARGLSAGPRVTVLSPAPDTRIADNDEITVEVAFEPSDSGAAPDMSTLEVVVRKGWFGRDITDLVEPYLQDTRLYAPAVSMGGHTGEFEFHIAVEDEAGEKGEEVFLITIDD